MADEDRLAHAHHQSHDGHNHGKEEERAYKNRENLKGDPGSGLPNEKVIWKGSTWPQGLASWCCCSQNWWTITNRRIDFSHGCCASSEETIDLRRVTDLRFERTCVQLMCCRGSLIVFVSEAENEKYTITTWGMKTVYEELKDAWLGSRQNVAVSGNGGYQNA